MEDNTGNSLGNGQFLKPWIRTENLLIVLAKFASMLKKPTVISVRLNHVSTFFSAVYSLCHLEASILEGNTLRDGLN